MPERFQDDESYQQMILSFRQGNQSSLAELYDRYAPALLGVINQILEDQELACDCLQHSFNEIWNKKASYDVNKERIFTWMLRIARNSALNFRENGHDSFNPGLNPESLEKCDKVQGLLINFEKVRAGVSPVGGSQPHEVLHLVFIKGFTLAEAAKHLNISTETAKLQYIFSIRQLKGKVTHE